MVTELVAKVVEEAVEAVVSSQGFLGFDFVIFFSRGSCTHTLGVSLGWDATTTHTLVVRPSVFLLLVVGSKFSLPSRLCDRPANIPQIIGKSKNQEVNHDI